MLTVQQAARLKGLHPSRITQLIKSNKIKAVRGPGRGSPWLILEEDLERAEWDSKPGPKAKK